MKGTYDEWCNALGKELGTVVRYAEVGKSLPPRPHKKRLNDLGIDVRGISNMGVNGFSVRTRKDGGLLDTAFPWPDEDGLDDKQVSDVVDRLIERHNGA